MTIRHHIERLRRFILGTPAIAKTWRERFRLKRPQP